MNCANHPDRERKAFCQNCGKPLCVECSRTVGQAVFCEPCLEERLAAANAATNSASTFGSGPTAGSASYQSVPGGGTAYRHQGTVEGMPYDVRGVTPPPGTPNPAIATLLGLIPGVGAMYNGQYGKGVVHLIVFAILVSLADQNGIFALFVAAWVFYQAIEAYHTARARRDGTPLPNPFGLNDVGERFGFGRNWPGPGPFSAAAPPAPGSVPPVQPFTPPPPPAGFSSGAGYGPAAAGAGYPAPAGTAGGADPAAWGAPADVYTGTGPYAATPVSPVLPNPSRFPIGAVILIGLGLLFLLGSTRFLEGLPAHYLLPALLIGIGVWIFVRRMTNTGTGFIDDGTPAYRLRLIRALQSSIWVILTGVLFLLDNLNILSWGRSWPLFIIVGGVMAFVQRSAYAAAAAQVNYPAYPPPARPAEPVEPSSVPGTSIVPHDREGL